MCSTRAESALPPREFQTHVKGRDSALRIITQPSRASLISVSAFSQIVQLGAETAIPRAIYFVCALTNIVFCRRLLFNDRLLLGFFLLCHFGLSL